MDEAAAKTRENAVSAEDADEVVGDGMVDSDADTLEDDVTADDDADDLDDDTDGLGDEADEDEDTDDETEEAEPVRQASYLALPILIRCAEARGDQSAAEEYVVQYEIAKKDRSLTEKARLLVAKIEEGIRAGAALSTEGLRLEALSEGMLAKLATLFGSEVLVDEVRVTADDSVLTITSKGVVTVTPA